MNIKFTKHTYTSKGEKIKHFLIGLFGWSIIGTLAFVLIDSFSTKNLFILIDRINFWIIPLCFIVLLAYFTLTKYWVAVGLATNLFINLFWLWWWINSILYGSIPFSKLSQWAFSLSIPFPLLLLISMIRG